MMRWALLAAIGVGCIHVSGSIPDGGTLMRECLEAWPSLRYRGIQSTTITNPGVTSSIRKAEIERDKHGRVRITYTGTGAVVLDDGRRTYQFSPATKQLHVGWSAPDRVLGSEARWKLIKRNYNFTNLGKATVAGRTCWVVRATPTHTMKYTRSFWVDALNHAPLKIEVTTAGGRLVFRSVFTAIDFSTPVSRVAFIPGFNEVTKTEDPRPRMYTDPAKLTRACGFAVRCPGAVPLGYVFSHGQVFPPSNPLVASSCVVKLYYTDGLSNVSMYQLQVSDRGKRTTSRAAGNECVLECVGDGLRTILIGDLEAGGLMRFHESLHVSARR